MKIGQTVAVCHDGKWGRRVKGEVVSTRHGNRILVKFQHPNNEEVTVHLWARWHNTVHYKKRKHNSCVSYGKQYGYFAGWADIDLFCPWFRISKWSDSDYKVTLKDKKLLWKCGIYS